MGLIHDAICKGGCKRCHGSKLVANSDDMDAWCHWAELPPGSDIAVRAGIVRAVPCPDCASGSASTGERRITLRPRAES